MKVTWPTALVLVAFLATYVTLTALGKEVPPWLMAFVAALGTSATAIMHKLFPDAPPPPPEGPSVVEVEKPITLRPLSRTDDELLAEVDDGMATWPPPPLEAA